MKKFIVISFLIWMLGFTYGVIFHETISKGNSDNSDYKEKYGFNDSTFNNFTVIFKNNLKGAIALVGGGLLFSSVTILLLLINGFEIANIILNSIDLGFPFFKIVMLFFPHSIEFLGIWMAGGIGLKITILMLRLISDNEKPTQHSLQSLLKYIIVSFAILFVAAIIESTISINLI